MTMNYLGSASEISKQLSRIADAMESIDDKIGFVIANSEFGKSESEKRISEIINEIREFGITGKEHRI